MRAVTGATNRVVIVGAGLAGLSAALWLASTGRQVTVVERGSGPGGCAGRREVGGFQFDTGPTVVTMPELIDETLAAVGENITDRLPLTRLSPAYRAHYADGTTLDVHADVARMEAEIERLCGAREAAGYRRLVHFAEQIYHLEMPHFINRNVGSLRDLRIGPLLRLARLGGFRTLAGKVNELLHDDRTRRLFSFQAMYEIGRAHV